MKLGCSTRLPAQCFYGDCESLKKKAGKGEHSPNFKQIVRKGSYFRSSDSKRIARFKCLVCIRTFSQASSSICFRQKKRRINEDLRKLLVSGVSERRAAKILRTTRKTVVRKSIFLGMKAVQANKSFVKAIAKDHPILEVQFDEMEAFERSKCLPVSIPLIVESETRRVLGVRVCSMPAKGHLADISRKKYGSRKDERSETANELFADLKPFISPSAVIKTDQNPKYPSWILPHFPQARHIAFKGRRGCVVGQGELKRGGFDPLFSLNHTAAMLRANINRLFRRTWCTTKKKERLALHIALFVEEHNRVITSKLSQLR
jgi:transposase-like protein